MLQFATICLLVAIITIFLSKGLWKKVLATNLTVSLLVMIIVLVGLETEVSYYLDVAFAFALLSFIGTQFFVRFLAAREGQFDE